MTRTLTAVLLAAVLTFATFFAVNARLHNAAAGAGWLVVNDGKHAAAVRQTLATWRAYANASSVEGFQNATPEEPEDGEGRAELANLVAFGRTTRPGFPETLMFTWLPVNTREIASPTEQEMIASLRNDCQRASAFLSASGSAAVCRDDAALSQAFGIRVSPSLSILADAFRGSWSYTIRRYINGLIQFVTVFLVFLGLFLLLMDFRLRLRREERTLENPTTTGACPYAIHAKIKSIAVDRIEPDEKAEAYANWLGEAAAADKSTSLKVLHSAVESFAKEKSVDAATRSAENRLQNIEDETDSWLEPVRYIVWAVPAVGFIGTVIGVGAAMIKADRIVGAGLDASAQRSAIQSITTDLGTAFDTTLVALLGSVFLMATYHYCLRRRQRMISTVRHATFDLLIPRMAGLSLEKIFRDLVERAVGEAVANVYGDMAKQARERAGGRRTEAES